MRSIRKHLHWVIPTLGLFTVVALVAWKDRPQQPAPGQSVTQDTVPAKRNKVTREAGERDLDKEIRQMDEAKERLKEVDWDRVKKSIEEAQKNIDFEKIRLQTELAAKQIDMEKISREVQESLKKIDFEKIQKEVNESLKNAHTYVDAEKIKKELAQARLEVERELKNKDWEKELEAVKKLNSEEFRKQMDQAKEEMEKARKELDMEKLGLKEKMEDAWVEIGKAKEEFKGYQEMIYSMEKDGLLSTKSDYTIKYKEGDLLINGKKQSQPVLDKYKKYFKKDNVTIRKEDGDMDIDFD
ncbi:hypothetical protein HB364_00085 [Pseudoflavitalea sp. X16]|uniref:hypothetical protein n=1 Tax=Paraflavitalea devenefica TaxID=2716334 RepID=UPI00142486AC|nr:hypothetical protein [Paraflavitalea devenefica]NII23456.1 hypothetical protein [Paraflavitalea devenefica]